MSENPSNNTLSEIINANVTIEQQSTLVLEDVIRFLMQINGTLGQGDAMKTYFITHYKSLRAVSANSVAAYEEDVDRVVKEVKKKRTHYRTLLDASDGLSISSSATGIAGTVMGWNPIGWVLMGVTVATSGTSIGLSVEGNKARADFIQYLSEVGAHLNQNNDITIAMKSLDQLCSFYVKKESAISFYDVYTSVMKSLLAFNGNDEDKVIAQFYQGVADALTLLQTPELRQQVLQYFIEILKPVQGDKTVGTKTTQFIEKLNQSAKPSQFAFAVLIPIFSAVVKVVSVQLNNVTLALQVEIAVMEAVGQGVGSVVLATKFANLTTVSNLATKALNAVRGIGIAFSIIGGALSIAGLVEREKEAKEADAQITLMEGNLKSVASDIFGLKKLLTE